MLCDECHKNEAVITYTEVVRGVRRELHLCKECAAKHTDKALEPLGDSFLADLLAGIFGLDKDEDELTDEDLQKTNLICPSCGMTYNEFLKNGLFGCPECYKTFNFLIDGYFRKVHGGAAHTGKKRYELRARRRQRRSLTASLEYRKADLFLKEFYLIRKRRLTDELILGRTAEIQGTGQFDAIIDLFGCHGCLRVI